MMNRLRTSHAAFTLLELLLATSVFALLTVLMSSLAGQLRAWTDEGVERSKSMQIQRVVELMRDQWAGRVSQAGAGKDVSVQTSASYLSFVTSRPVLDLSFPIVRATYRWVPTRSDADEERFDLMYEESPVGRVTPERPKTREESAKGRRSRSATTPQDEDKESRGAAQRTRDEIENPKERWPLLEDCEHGGWDRFGRGGVVLRNERAERRGVAPTAEYEFANDAQLRDEEVFRWRGYADEIPGAARAMRLMVEQGEEACTCVFVIAASR